MLMAMRDTGTERDGIMFFATAACMPESGTTVPAGAGGATAAGLVGAVAAAAGAAPAFGVGGKPAAVSMSAAVMRPFKPVPPRR